MKAIKQFHWCHTGGQSNKLSLASSAVKGVTKVASKAGGKVVAGAGAAGTETPECIRGERHQILLVLLFPDSILTNLKIPRRVSQFPYRERHFQVLVLRILRNRCSSHL